MLRKLLVANRGEIVQRIARTCRAMGVASVAVFSDPDVGAPFVAAADEAVPLGGATPAESYLRIDALLDAAERTGADAVHPGYGFLAENAEFARAVVERGLVFVGPPPDAIAAMADKAQAKRLMAAAGVPVLPGAALAAPDGAAGGGDDRDALAAAAAAAGWPLLVKAALGGGGTGMAVVREPAALGAAVAGARRLAGAAFGNDAVLLERYVDGARHVEAQILGDTHGQVAFLGERECSIQRRHQKLVEEAPSPAVGAALREQLAGYATAAARAIGYHGAGTVEFLLTPAGELFFLEMNTRLQVEHPVTEAVTGLDLVRLQLLVAGGEPLPAEALAPAASGHAIEARLYAEDPRNGFLPSSGTLHRFRVPAIGSWGSGGPAGVRVDAGVADGSVVGVHYDPLLAKVVAHAPTRSEAAARLAAALAGARVHGLASNRDLLVRVLRHPAFLAGETDTGFLERHGVAALAAPLADAAAERLHAAAAALAAQAGRVAARTVQAGIPSGWRNNPSQPQRVAFRGRGGELAVGYRFARDGRALAELAVAGEPLAWVRLRSCSPDLVDLEAGGVRRRIEVHRVGTWHFVDSPLGSSALEELPRFPAPAGRAASGSLRSPLPGIVARVDARPGERVAEGAVLVVIEAMKLEHRVTAPRAARVAEVLVRPAQEIAAGAVLVVLEGSGEPGTGAPENQAVEEGRDG